MPEEKNPIKEAFGKVKSDIYTLESQILSLTREIQSLKRTLLQTNLSTDKPTDTQTAKQIPPKVLASPLLPNYLPTTNDSEKPIIDLNEYPFIQTNSSEKETIPISGQTHSSHFPQKEPLKPSNSQVSTGNRGVPTDRQTNQQTDKYPLKRTLEPPSTFSSFPASSSSLNELSEIPSHETKPLRQVGYSDDKIPSFLKVSELVNSLDALKKDIRSKFKKLTPQEMQVYSIIYQLSDEGFLVDYPLLASKTSLSESSIRDYILKLTKKGIPLEKTKENNKRVILSVPQDFKKIASLSTIISLREI